MLRVVGSQERKEGRHEGEWEGRERWPEELVAFLLCADQGLGVVKSEKLPSETPPTKSLVRQAYESWMVRRASSTAALLCTA